MGAFVREEGMRHKGGSGLVADMLLNAWGRVHRSDDSARNVDYLGRTLNEVNSQYLNVSNTDIDKLGEEIFTANVLFKAADKDDLFRNFLFDSLGENSGYDNVWRNLLENHLPKKAMEYRRRMINQGQ